MRNDSIADGSGRGTGTSGVIRRAAADGYGGESTDRRTGNYSIKRGCRQCVPCRRVGYQTATGAYGGSATHYEGVGTVGTTSYGSTVVATDHYYRGSTATYSPPVVVNSYFTGCYKCGGWSTAGAGVAGDTVDVMAGAATASANTASPQPMHTMPALSPGLPIPRVKSSRQNPPAAYHLS
jgi:hypothetical protein